MSSLPIDALYAPFIEHIQKDNLIVEAETGSGKSTRLPLWAAEKGRVLVVEPRRIACTSLAEYLSAEKGEQLGDSIGYAIKLKNCYSPETKVVFVTPGVALRWYADNKLAEFSTIIVDEFHERRWDTDLLVALLKHAPTHRLVVTSATLEGSKLAQYLRAQGLTSKGRTFHVDLIHRAMDSRHLPDARGLEKRVTDEVLIQLENRTYSGDILVFLPGKKEIHAVKQSLNGLDDVLVVPLHASVSDSERQLALEVQEKRKVVLATNVAETSLTIPNITTVIDSGLERRTEQRNGQTTLSLKHISKSSAAQRAGRAGRVMDGQCIRLYGQHAALIAVTPPEMHREALTEAMLASACCEVNLESLTWLDSLPEKSLAAAKGLLMGMGAINADGLATNHGKQIYPLPIDAVYADLVTRIEKKSLKEAMVDLTAALSTPANLYSVVGDELALDELNRQEPLGCDGQLLIALIRGKSLSAIATDTTALLEARQLASQMREMFDLPKLEVASRYQHSELIKEIARLHPELVFVRREKRHQALANGDMEVSLDRMSRFKDDQQAALVLNTYSLPGRGVRQTLNLATVTMPLPFSLLLELEIGDWQQAGTVEDNGQTLVCMELVYAGRAVAKRYAPAEGQLAIQPMVEAVLNGDLLPGLAKKRKTEIEHWKLYVELGLSDVHSQHTDDSFESWFTEQLTLLELDSMEDLALFTVDDFQFEGIPYWEYEDFAQRFPFELSLGNLNLTVEYFSAKKLVQVVYRDGLRKEDPKRWELPKWTGWRVQYKKASRIVQVN